MKVWITGATGLCGRAVTKLLSDSYDVVPTAFSRAEGNIFKVDITSKEDVKAFFEKHNPDAVVHLAAERKPDICENKKDVTDNLNIEATRFLAEQCKQNDCWFLYLSTDYVFDGTKPPYLPTSEPNPLNYYGESKLKGEIETLKANDKAAVLRVPVLYGEVEELGESAVTTIFNLLKKQEEAKVDHWATRFPTLVDDIAKVIAKMLSGKPSGTFHYSGETALTKYETALLMGELMNVSTDKLIAEPNQTGTALRPKNAQLDTASLKAAGFYVEPSEPKDVLAAILRPHL
ncbi:MAG: SDR family oxidoreductase [Lentisphaeraceae bacterium]|nr:SDR family oxidoreductase [Lentisphaeraceae bacterium]